MTRSNRNIVVIAAGFLGTAAVFLSVLLFTSDNWIQAIVNHAKSLGKIGIGLYGVTFIIATVFLVPSTPFVLGSGFLYGVINGSIVTSLATTISATISFVCARYLARDWVQRKISRYQVLPAFNSALEESGFKVVALMRLQPVFIPFVYLNMGLGLTQVRLRDFVLGSWLGMLPGTIVFVYFGSLVRSVSELSVSRVPKPFWHSAWLWLGFLVATLLLLTLGRVAKRALRSS
jgi:uncharacterized membrane protein YdjX (TVP38/TMEM64 family)